MPRKRQEPSRGPMIHVRLDEKTHHELKVHAVSSSSTIQSVVASLIRRMLDEENKEAVRTHPGMATKETSRSNDDS